MTTETVKSYIKNECGMFCDEVHEGIQQEHGKLEDLPQSRNTM